MPVPSFRRIRPSLLAAVLLPLLLAGPGLAHAQFSAQTQAEQENTFAIAPPPLAYPDYGEPGSTQGRITATHVQVGVGPLQLTGLGLAYVQRWVLPQHGDGLGQALSLPVGAYTLSGSTFGLSVDAKEFSLGLNYERELIDFDGARFAAFAGLQALSQQFSGGNILATTRADGRYYGGQVGGQFAIPAAAFVVSPFFQYQRLTGTYDSEAEAFFPTYERAQANLDVDLTSTVIGLDVLHRASGLTLSGMLQAVESDRQEADVTTLQVSYAFGGTPAEAP